VNGRNELPSREATGPTNRLESIMHVQSLTAEIQSIVNANKGTTLCILNNYIPNTE